MSNRAEDLRVLVTLLRRLRGPWSQAEMAARAEVNPGSISTYESGDRSPSPAAIEKLAGAAPGPPRGMGGLLLPGIAGAPEIDPGPPALPAGRALQFGRTP